MDKKNCYNQIIEVIFFTHFKKNQQSFEFDRVEIEHSAKQLGITLPKNFGDLIYTFRYRAPLPDKIQACAPKGKEWLILPAGKSRYRFVASRSTPITANEELYEVKIPDATPGIISMYALSDEQALLAKLRYNRLIDIFTRVTCYSLQNHLRTQVHDMGQAEIDELYIGVDRKGSHYVFPVQAKGGKDKLNYVQVYQDLIICKTKFPSLICRPIGAQFLGDKGIVLFEFIEENGTLKILTEKHYQLVPPGDLSSQDLVRYKAESSDDE